MGLPGRIRSAPVPPRAFLLAASVLVLTATLGATCDKTKTIDLAELPEQRLGASVSFDDQVRPVLERRCVVCHGCYDAPCQLQLSSYEGIERGASKDAVYYSNRLTEADPSRLFIDARSVAAWRDRGFFPVAGDAARPSDSLMLRMLALGRTHIPTVGEKLPESLPLGISRELSCPTSKEFGAYEQSNPLGGMPYGTAPLSDPELSVLAAWVRQGAKAPPTPAPLPRDLAAQVTRWERFLNGSSPKQQITARYLYEHWFLAHLYFEDLPEGPFFRVVRSSMPSGLPVNEIASRRPFDDPGVTNFWYRLVPVHTSIVHKTHIVYALGDARMQRLSELFLESDWTPTRTPAYGIGATNPFVIFDQIPARSRYQFLLDDARYFIATFIRGPVCRGQVAIDVIEDHFFVAFLDPEHDLSIIDSDYLERAAKLLALPEQHGSRVSPGNLWLGYNVDQGRYLDLRQKAYDDLDPERRGPSLDAIWDGDGSNRNALLTAFRHFDNAAVVKGFVGEIPKTAWVMDYPIFERIYYDLVADFDVFGSVTHRVSTRLYMDHLRMQSENLFLAFLPEDRRESIRASWYVGADKKHSYRSDNLRSLGHGTQIQYQTDDPKTELLEMLLARSPQVSGPPDLLNRCTQPPCDRKRATSLERKVERTLQSLAGVRGPWVATLPELMLLRVRSGEQGRAVYTLIHNRAHTNVASLFGEDDRLVPEEDTLTIVPGYLGSYPNFLFDVETSQIGEFAAMLAEVTTPDELESVVDRWGMRRTATAYWQTFDWIHDDFHRRDPTEYGLFDLARYENL